MNLLSFEDLRVEVAPMLPENASFVLVPHLRVRSWQMENSPLYARTVAQLGDEVIVPQTRRFIVRLEGTFSGHSTHQLLREAALQAKNLRVKLYSQTHLLVQGQGLVSEYEETVRRRLPMPFTAMLRVAV
jgi:hypothetical protein